MNTDLGGRIAADRRDQGLTQQQVAAELDVTQPAVQKWESGASYPTASNLRGLADLLGWDRDTLVRFALREPVA